MQAIADNQGILTLGALAVVAVLLLVLVFAVMRRPADAELSESAARLAATEQRLGMTEAERDTLRAELSDERVARGRIETERDTLRNAAGLLEDRLRERDEKIAERDREISALKVAERGLTAERDGLQADCHELEAARDRLQEQLRQERETVRAREIEIGALKGNVQELTATLRAERDKHADLIKETMENRAQFVAQFKAISGEILQNQGKAASEAQRTELEKIINPFKAEIEGLKTNLRDISDKAEKERQTLGNQLLLMQSKAAELSEQANGLTRALRGDKKMQGNWGEMVLERLLEAAGLQEGFNYTRQGSVIDDRGNRLIPDVVLHLPGERDIVIDSKVTLNAYQDLVQAADREAEAAALKRHVQSIRNHIRSLSDKRYDGLGTFGSVMMFLPIDEALSVAISADHNLQLEAAEKRVHLVTPSTLFPTLTLVEHLWTIDRRNQNVDDIVDRAGKLHDKFVLVVESIQKIGEHLKKASDCQDDAMKRMSEGPGNVIGQVDKLRQLGAKARKSLPGGLLEDSDGEDPALADEAERPALAHSA